MTNQTETASGALTPLVALIVLDGFGCAPPGPGNAITQARTPFWDALLERYPHTRLECSGEAVGLPAGQIGNSEVGHLNLGAGRVVYQGLTRINKDIKEGTFFHNEAFLGAFASAEASHGRLHLMGLLSNGGVHSQMGHLKALLQMAHDRAHVPVYLHLFLDGRDVPPTSASSFIKEIEAFISDLGTAQIASVCGRYYAMDRDNRWERTKAAYDVLVHCKGQTALSPLQAIQQAHQNGITDEFIPPTTIEHEAGGAVRGGDSIIFFNFRPDRQRQLTRAFSEVEFSGFDRGPEPPFVHAVTMTEYDPALPVQIAYAPHSISNVLADVFSVRGLWQLHVAETEKYAHVTFFFNGGEEQAKFREVRRLVPSPREVATYDQKPEMSAYELAEALPGYLAEHDFSFLVLNFANADMVGHSGNIQATVKAIEALDKALARVVEAVNAKGGICLITADHGNAEAKLLPDGTPATAHTTNPVPFLVTHEGVELKDGGKLADVAPTVLRLLGLDPPAEMTGKSLIAGLAKKPAPLETSALS